MRTPKVQHKIPKIVHHIWTSGDPYASIWHEYRTSWMRCNPDYTFMFWDIDAIMSKLHLFKESSRLLLKSDLFWEVKFDVATWDILYLYGGIKADHDTICQKSFDDLLNCSSFVAEGYDECEVGISIVGMSQQNPLAIEIGEEVNKQINIGMKSNFDKKFYYYTDIYPVPVFKKCERHLPREFFYPYPWKARKVGAITKYPDAYAVHTWGAFDLHKNGWEGFVKEARKDEKYEKATQQARDYHSKTYRRIEI